MRMGKRDNGAERSNDQNGRTALQADWFWRGYIRSFFFFYTKNFV